jgi:hypothetical protein
MKKQLTPRQQLDGFLAKYSPEIVRQARAVLTKMRKRLPGAVQLVYDNYNALVVGFGPSERASEALFSVALYPNHISVCFLYGAGLSDPHRLLRGSGNRVRHIRLADETTLDDPAVQALITAALDRRGALSMETGRGTLIIKSISKAQRPRRPRN